MSLEHSLTLNAQLKRIAATGLIVLGLAAAVGAFSIGFTGALTQSLADPASAPRMRAAALGELDETLGYGGFLGVYRAFLVTASPMQAAKLRRLADDADASVAAFFRAGMSTADHDYAASLQRQIAPFQRASADAAAAMQTAGDRIAIEQLDRNYAALKKTIAAAADEANFARIDDLAEALTWAQATAVGGLAALAATLFALAWFLREHLIVPLSRLRRSVNDAAAGRSDTLWGIDRHDEIGAVARAAERLRQRAQADADKTVPRLHLDIMRRLAEGAVTLQADISNAAVNNSQARIRIEQAGLRAAEASHAAMEAAELVRQSANCRMRSIGGTPRRAAPISSDRSSGLDQRQRFPNPPASSAFPGPRSRKTTRWWFWIPWRAG
jgi:HAMP domain-containing protein